jgi:hypothetical protein
MIRGYFAHKFPLEIAESYGFTFVQGKIGTTTDPAFGGLWDQTAAIHRGIYQKPMVTMVNNAYEHSSFLVELCQQHNPQWDDFPLVLNILQPNVDLTFISTWLEQIYTELHPKMKPLLYTTVKHWNTNLQGGPNAEPVSKTILLNAELLVSQYKVELPEKPLYVTQVRWWEYSNGRMQFAEDGVFEKQVVTPIPVDTGGGDQPGTGMGLLGDITLHMVCPHCGVKIF